MNIKTDPIVNPQRDDQMKPSMVKRQRPNNDRPKPVQIILNSFAGSFYIDSGGIDWTKWLFWRVPTVLALYDLHSSLMLPF